MSTSDENFNTPRSIIQNQQMTPSSAYYKNASRQSNSSQTHRNGDYYSTPGTKNSKIGNYISEIVNFLDYIYTLIAIW